MPEHSKGKERYSNNDLDIGELVVQRRYPDPDGQPAYIEVIRADPVILATAEILNLAADGGYLVGVQIEKPNTGTQIYEPLTPFIGWLLQAKAQKQEIWKSKKHRANGKPLEAS